MGIPFLASNVGGIPEIVADPELQKALLFDPTAKSLRAKLDQYLATPPHVREQYIRRLQDISNAAKNKSRVCQAYADMLPQTSAAATAPAVAAQSMQPAAPAESTAHNQPLVTICVPYYNLGELLPETLDSIAAQDYPNLEVIVINDGSTDAYALEVWEQMQQKFPHWRFVTQSNQGLGAARNTALNLANGEFFLPIDSDNIARPFMISRFVQALERNPNVAVATCLFLAFEETTDLARRKYCYAYRPCGGPYVAAALRNVYGDANAMSRTVALRAVGGYGTEKHTGYEDWETYVKLAQHGYELDVIPEYLFFYRHRPTSMFRTTDLFLNHRRVLRQFFAPHDLPAAEQMQLWTALASLDERHRQLQWALSQAHNHHHDQPGQKNRRGVRKAVFEFREVMRRTTKYHVFFNKIKGKQAA
jgi:GT2 family glycosyltransferase